MRKIDFHKINPANDKLEITAIDEPGSGGANHIYEIKQSKSADLMKWVISFQNGPINENGINGITQEILLAIVIDRLKSFQDGPFPSRENEKALTHCEEALHWLQQRTLDRMRRGVEGQTKA